MNRSLGHLTIALAAMLVVAAPATAADPSTAPSPGPGASDPWIVYQSPQGLALVHPDGTGKDQLFGHGGPRQARHADLSPDGSRVVFEADRDDGTTEIWVAGSDGSDAAVLVGCQAPCATVQMPAWSPDGRSIAYWVGNIDGDLASGVDVQVIDVTSEEIRTIVSTTGPEYVDAVRWSPDGRRLVVAQVWFADAKLATTEMTRRALGIIDLDAASPSIVEIPGLPDYPSYPDWHPIEDVITFQTGAADPFLREGTPPGLYTVGIDGRGLTQLLPDRAADEPYIALPAWTPDGTGIIVTLVIAKGKHSLAVVARDGSRLDAIGGADPVMGAHAHQQRGATAP